MVLVLLWPIWILRCLANPRKHQKASRRSITIQLFPFDDSPSKQHQFDDPSSYFRCNLNVVVLINGYLHIIDDHSYSIDDDIYQISSMLQLPAYSVDVSQPTKAPHFPSSYPRCQLIHEVLELVCIQDGQCRAGEVDHFQCMNKKTFWAIAGYNK